MSFRTSCTLGGRVTTRTVDEMWTNSAWRGQDNTPGATSRRRTLPLLRKARRMMNSAAPPASLGAAGRLPGELL